MPELPASCQPHATLVVYPDLSHRWGENILFQGGLWRCGNTCGYFHLSILLVLMLPNTSQDTCSACRHPGISGIIHNLLPELSKGQA